VGTGDLTDAPAGPVSVDTVFDRFPASVRGAVVVRSLDREPHQIRLIAVRVVEAHDRSREVQEVSVEQVTVDVAPHREVLVPFDVPFSGLGPGWYCVVGEVEIDGSRRLRGPDDGGRRFVVPWPAAEVRRADLRPNLEIKLPGVGTATIERVECKLDHTAIRWRLTGAEKAELRVSVGKRRLPTVESTYDDRAGAHITVTHPIPKRATEIAFDVSVRAPNRAKATATLDFA